MRQLSWNGRGLVAVVLAVALLGSFVIWLSLRARGADEAATSLPACAELAGTELGELGEDPAWNGCLTGAGAAVTSYRYECSGLREVLLPSGEEERLADESAVVLLPDVGLVGAAGQPWAEASTHAAYGRTPFDLLRVPYRCDELRSLPHEGVTPVGCDLDDVPLVLVSTQGCRLDGEVHLATGRTCSYPDFDITTSWEQWSIEVPAVAGPGDSIVLESGPDGQWWMVPRDFRDERCATPPAEWDPAWG